MKTAKRNNPLKAKVSFLIYFDRKHIKVELAHGEKAEFHYSRATDEGWNSSAMRLRREGGMIYRDIHNDGRDCDGRLETFSECVCPTSELRAHYVPVYDENTRRHPQPKFFPWWQSVESSQRDHTAEAAGY